MADEKNEVGKSQTESGAGKVSAGTSVGNIGEAPMPHAHDEKKSAQSTTPASHTSHSMGGNQSRDEAQRQPSQRGQGESMTDKAQQMAGDMRQRAEEVYEGASEWARDTYDRTSEWASDAYEGQRRRVRHMGDRSGRAFGGARDSMQQYVSENPMVVGLVGLAAGLLLGALLPRTRRENEFFGEWADEVRNQGLHYAREAAGRGREYVEEAFGGEEAQQFGRREGEPGSERRDMSRH